MFSNASRRKNPHNIYRPFWYKEDYEGNTNEKNCNTDDSQSDNDYLVRNLKKSKIIKDMVNAKNILLWLLKKKSLS